ncbi:hypothetical protein L3Y34_013527 [Caenorhabditis briggsae]|nr:hypothetical protein L3Y34_013527 [Caenorhabditis briggsae]
MTRAAEYHEYATKFLRDFTNYLVKEKMCMKLLMFVYATIMYSLVFFIEGDSFKIQMDGVQICSSIVLTEMALGASLTISTYALLYKRAVAMAPLLFFQSVVLMYGFSHYLVPFLDMQYRVALMIFEEDNTTGTVLWTCFRLLVLFISRIFPLIIQLGFTIFTIKIIFCLMLVENVESRIYLPYHRSTVPMNSRVWSSIRRKISVRQFQDSSTQTLAGALTDPELVSEMSAKFKGVRFPQALVHQEDLC